MKLDTRTDSNQHSIRSELKWFCFVFKLSTILQRERKSKEENTIYNIY